ncbi:hypothetical protein K438DRAFT_1956164 [Mycena galopus ATCC 62051]|nr:hypothetical protein K438DRAFT_1956164 [Mycena galopus ATCC 62051]
MTTHLRRRLADLDTKILEQRQVLQQLHQTRSDVERELHATATYPVLTLPTEITAEIFLCCLPVFDPLCIPNHKSSAPIVLTAVCRQWRDIALATPVLWSKLQVRFGKIAPEIVLKPTFIEGIIDRWLDRAGNRPLLLEFEHRSGTKSLFTLSRFRKLIHRWSPRVQYLSLDMGWHDMRPLDLNSANFPLLQGAALACDDDAPIILFSTSPHFHDLRLLCELTLDTFALPWHQLTKFTGMVLWDLQLFTLAPNLTEITCGFDFGVADFVVTTHHNLRSLTVDEESDDIIQYLTLPALRYLDVSHADACHDSLQSFLARSSPPLVSLSVQMNDSDGSDSYFTYLNQCTRLVAGTLKILEIVHVYNKDIIPIFISLGESLPNLESISFKDCDGPVDLPDLVHFLYQFDKLRTFKLVWTSSPFLDATLFTGPSTGTCEDTISGHLSRLSQKGMEIYLGTADKDYAAIGDAVINQNLV